MSGDELRETHIEVGEHLWEQASCWWYDEVGVAATSNEVDMLDEIMRLRAERDASQLTISDLTAQLERQRAAILLLGLADIERLAADNERLRAEVAVLRDELRLAGEEARRG